MVIRFLLPVSPLPYCSFRINAQGTKTRRCLSAFLTHPLAEAWQNEFIRYLTSRYHTHACQPTCLRYQRGTEVDAGSYIAARILSCCIILQCTEPGLRTTALYIVASKPVGRKLAPAQAMSMPGRRASCDHSLSQTSTVEYSGLWSTAGEAQTATATGQ